MVTGPSSHDPRQQPPSVPFVLPNDSWRLVEESSAQSSTQVMCAVRDGSEGDLVPVLRVDAHPSRNGLRVAELAADALASFTATAADVEVVATRELGSEQAPALVQIVGGTVKDGVRPVDLRQAQVFIALRDDKDPDLEVVLQTTYSATYSQFEEFMGEVNGFISGFVERTVSGTSA